MPDITQHSREDLLPTGAKQKTITLGSSDKNIYTWRASVPNIQFLIHFCYPGDTAKRYLVSM